MPVATHDLFRYAPVAETTPVSADLADWFQARLLAGTLPAAPFELAPALLVSAPAILYDWIVGVIVRGDRGATAREAECAIRSLIRHVGEALPGLEEEDRQP